MGGATRAFSRPFHSSTLAVALPKSYGAGYCLWKHGNSPFRFYSCSRVKVQDSVRSGKSDSSDLWNSVLGATT